MRSPMALTCREGRAGEAGAFRETRTGMASPRTTGRPQTAARKGSRQPATGPSPPHIPLHVLLADGAVAEGVARRHRHQKLAEIAARGREIGLDLVEAADVVRLLSAAHAVT